MMLPGEAALREEREAIVATMRSLSPDEFESGPTLCDRWAPRDVLAHVMAVDRQFLEYVRAGGWINTANAISVRKARRLAADALLAEADEWVRRPSVMSRVSGWWLLGDNAIHHEDVLRPMGRSRDIPEASRNAILRWGAVYGARRLLHHRIEPTDGGWPLGRGQVVRGTRAALGLWLAGRDGLDDEIEHVGSKTCGHCHAG